MILKYMKVSLFEIGYKKNELFHDNLVVLDVPVYRHITFFLTVLFIKPCNYFGFDNLFEQIRIACLIVSLYINIVILKF